MRRSIIRIGFITSIMLSTGEFLYSQTMSPNFNNQYAPTQPSLEQVRYGVLPVDLSSGVLSMEIPIGSYSDEDFDIPISLRYSYDGFKPLQPSGNAGLGWNLSAGGCITREIVGIDDFKTQGYSNSPFSDTAENVYGLGSWVSPLSHNNTTYPSIGGQKETTSDIYHFSFPGHSGSFVIANDGTFTAYGTSGERGTYSISHDGNNNTFTITTSDGKIWRFGFTGDSREIMLVQNGIQDTQAAALSENDEEIPVVTWLLDQVTAPNGRKVEFTYTHAQRKYLSIPASSEDVITTFSRGINKEGNTTRYKFASLVYTTYLSSITVKELSGSIKQVAGFSWETKSYREIVGTEDPAYTKMIVATRRLTGVTLYEGTATTLRTATLSYNDSRHRPLLTSVSIPVFGTWEMTYNLPAGNADFPGQLTNAVDMWGYYNGATSNNDSDISPMSVNALTYDEYLSNTNLDPDASYSIVGTLQQVKWPTGGTTAITYEGHDAYKMVRRKCNPSLTPIPDDRSVSISFTASLEPVAGFLHSSACGGVRVKTITQNNVVDAPATRSYSYTDADGHSSGIIQEFNRYYAGKVGGVDSFNPNLRYPGNGFDQRHIAYTMVTETYPDGSYEKTSFSSWADEPDTFSSASQFYLSSGYTDNAYLNFINNILREGDSRAYRRGLPLEKKLYSNGVLLKEEQYTYTDLGDSYAAYIVGSGEYWWSARRFLADRVPSTIVTVYHPAAGKSLSSTTEYTYDSYGRQLSETVTDSDQTKRQTSTAYLSGVVQPSLVSSVSKSIKPVGTSSYITTENIAYTYVHTGNLWNKTSETKTLYDASGTGTVADQVQYASYNAIGKPCQVTANTDNMAIVWGYGGRYPVALVENCTYSELLSALRSTLSGELSNAQIKALYELTGKAVHAYSYTPSVGLTREIGPSGRSVSYTYDALGRLSTIKDAGGTVLQSFSYGTRTYIEDTSLRQVTTVTNQGSGNSRSEDQVQDGLGREWMHIVAASGTVNPKALVSLIGHDGLGREVRSYLPYAASSIIPVTAYSHQSAYWGTDGAYAHTLRSYDGGPMDRLLSETAPGKAIRNANKSRVINYSTNDVYEVPFLLYNATTGAVTVSGYHLLGSLLREETVMPDGETSIEFTTLSVRPVLSRVQKGSDLYDTYYVHDLHDRKSWVFSPGLGAAIRSAASGYGITYQKTDATVLANCFLYEYDSRGNQITLHRPSGGNEAATYDNAHRVFTERTASLNRARGVYVRNAYDNLGRKTAAYLTRSNDLYPVQPTARTTAESDDRPEQERSFIETVHTISTYTYGQSTSVDCITNDSPGTPYANIPSALTFAARSGIVSAVDLHVTGELIWEEQFPVIGPVYPADIPILYTDVGNDMFGDDPAKTAYYYDGKGRVVQTVIQWPDGSISRVSTSHDLEGNVLAELEEYHPAGTGQYHWVWTENTYDTRSQLRSYTIWAGQGATPAKNAALIQMSGTVSWDEVGRMSGKSITKGSNTLSAEYSATIQGWAESTTFKLNGAGIFQEQLKYWNPAHTATEARYGGKISEAYSMQSGYTARTEGYSYDQMGRLVGNTAFIGSSNTAQAVHTESFTYDALSRPVTMTRYGVSGAATAGLSFAYNTNGLTTNISDAVGGNSWSIQYAADGSLSQDTRSGYYFADNYLGLTAQIAERVTASSKIITYNELANYIYLPDGTKIEAGLTGGDRVLYRGRFTYKKTAAGVVSLESIALPDGKILVSGSTWTPYGEVKDRLGNVRALVNLTSGTVVERTDYYPYGTKITQPTSSSSTYPQLAANRWRYAGKEEQSNVTGTGYLDFGARQFDPTIGLWLSPDPMADDYPGLSPFVYCAADPVNIVDPEGKFPEILWDIFNVVLDVKSLVDNVKQKEWGAAALDAGGLTLDAVVAIIPIVPGGAGTAIKASRAADAAIDAVQAIDKTQDAANALNKVESISDVTKAVHGNSKASSKAQHAYDIVEIETGVPYKTGVSGGNILKNGKSARAESQVRKWNKKAGYEKFESVIYFREPAGPGARVRVLDVEKRRAKMHKHQGYLQDPYYHQHP